MDGPTEPTGNVGRSTVTMGREHGCWAEGGSNKCIEHSTCLNLVLGSQNRAWHCTKLQVPALEGLRIQGVDQHLSQCPMLTTDEAMLGTTEEAQRRPPLIFADHSTVYKALCRHFLICFCQPREV